VEAARDEATRGLADFARDALPGSVRRELAVECRDEADRDAPSPESPLTEVLRNSGGEFGRKGLVYGRTVSGNLECSGA
jgi:hypothetical protein